MKDIESKDDIKVLVDTFYEKIKTDILLGPVFWGVLHNKWDAHLQIMYMFWDTVLFNTGEYTGNTLAKHMDMPLRKEQFTQWLLLFNQTTDELFAGAIAELAKQKAAQIAQVMMHKKGFAS